MISENVFDGRVYLSLIKDSNPSTPMITENTKKTVSSSVQKKKKGSKVIRYLNNYFAGLINDDLNKKNITKEIEQF